MKKQSFAVMAALLIFLPAVQGFAQQGFKEAEEKPVSAATQSSLSSLKTYKNPATSQKAYQITNRQSPNARILEYDSKPGFDTFEDKDSDGRFGEKEAKGVDNDRDGRKGEQEIQLGTENVTMNQKITVLNNMRAGGGLSNFQAAGQTTRSSVFLEKETEEPARKTSSKKETSESLPKNRVLIS